MITIPCPTCDRPATTDDALATLTCEACLVEVEIVDPAEPGHTLAEAA